MDGTAVSGFHDVVEQRVGHALSEAEEDGHGQWKSVDALVAFDGVYDSGGGFVGGPEERHSVVLGGHRCGDETGTDGGDKDVSGSEFGAEGIEIGDEGGLRA